MNNSPKPDLDALLTVENVAHLFMVSPMTIRSWAQNGRIPAVKMGRLWRFRRADVEAWLVALPTVDHPAATLKPQPE